MKIRDKMIIWLILLTGIAVAGLIISIISITDGKNGNHSSHPVVVKGRNIHMPPGAIQLSENVYSLGTCHFRNYTNVKGFALLHTSTGSPFAVIPPMTQDQHLPCCSFIAPGARWKSTENFAIDPSNSQSLSEQFVLDALEKAMGAWNAVLNFNLFGNKLSAASVDGPDLVSPDGKNEILFALLSGNSVIATTFIWIDFNGNTIIEADIVFNENFDWGNSSVNFGVVDLQNIATHEFGHYIGLGHSANSAACNDVTMFPFSNFNEIKKRSLEDEDKDCACNLYSDPGCANGSDEEDPFKFKSHANSLSVFNGGSLLQMALIIFVLLVVL